MHLQTLQGQGPTGLIIISQNAKLTASDLVEKVVDKHSACEQTCCRFRLAVFLISSTQGIQARMYIVPMQFLNPHPAA